MSEPFFNTRKNQLKFINLCISAHDFGCDCDKPGFHTLKILTQQIYKELEEKDKQEIKKCLGETTTADGDGDALDALDDVDLDALFGEDTTDDTG